VAAWRMKCRGQNSCGWEWNIGLDGRNPNSPPKCPRCRKSNRIPAEAFTGRHQAAAGPAARGVSRPATALASRRTEPSRPVQPQRHEPGQPEAAGNEALFRLLGQLAGGLIAGKPGMLAGDAVGTLAGKARQPITERVLEGVIIPPGRPGTDLVPAAQGRKRAPKPPPKDRMLAPACRGCRGEPKRAATWPRSSWQLELSEEAVAAGLPFLLELCGNHVRQVPQEAITVLRRWEGGRWVLDPPAPILVAPARCNCGSAYDPALPGVCPCGRAAFRPSGGSSPAGSHAAGLVARPAPNPTIEQSGVYRRALAHAG
jgi:hypothetical protein